MCQLHHFHTSSLKNIKNKDPLFFIVFENLEAPTLALSIPCQLSRDVKLFFIDLEIQKVKEDILLKPLMTECSF